MPADFEEALTTWTYSAGDTDQHRGTEPDMNMKPLALVKARARAAHRAARLWQHLEWSSQAVTSYKQWQDEEAAKSTGTNTMPQTIAAVPT